MHLSMHFKAVIETFCNDIALHTCGACIAIKIFIVFMSSRFTIIPFGHITYRVIFIADANKENFSCTVISVALIFDRKLCYMISSINGYEWNIIDSFIFLQNELFLLFNLACYFHIFYSSSLKIIDYIFAIFNVSRSEIQGIFMPAHLFQRIITNSSCNNCS